MIGPNEIEQIIYLIHNGCSLDALAVELDIPIEQLQAYQQQLELRKFAKCSIKTGKISEAIEKLTCFIEEEDNSLVEKMMLLKLQAYSSGNSIDEDELVKLEADRKELGLTRSIEELLRELQLQIPKRKRSNKGKEQNDKQEDKQENAQEDSSPDYEKTIARYQAEITQNPQRSQTKRNLLAFAYFKAGRIDEARDELMALIEECSSYMAYRQLIHLEKSQGNLEDAKMWCEACLEQFPNNIDTQYQLISIATEENNSAEAIKQLRKILDINPNSQRTQAMLKAVESEQEK